MPKVTTEAKQRAKTFEDVFVSKPAHDHCKQVLASKRIRDACFTGWDTSREPYFPEDKGCFFLAANLEICPTTGREHWQGVACFNTVQPAGKVRGMLGQPTAHVGQRAGELSDCIAYCTKPESRKPGTEPVIKGQPRCLKQVKGERSDLNRAREIIQEHKTWTQVINDRSLCDVLARHPRWAHDVFENRAARPQWMRRRRWGRLQDGNTRCYGALAAAARRSRRRRRCCGFTRRTPSRCSISTTSRAFARPTAAGTPSTPSRRRKG